MAIDGVKIIDSDDGWDIYNYVVESYKDGVGVDKIISTILEDEENYCTNDFYAEIYWTAFAYSLWKIGDLPDNIRNKALEIIEKGADEFWLEIDSKALKQRQRVLDKLAIQLKSENTKPIKVLKIKKKLTPYFSKGDVLSVKFEDEYGVVFVSRVDESPGKIEYHLACSRLLKNSKPDINDFLNSQIACSKHEKQYWIDTDCWFNHKKLGALLDKFEKIGQIELEDYLLGTLAPASTIEDIYEEIIKDKEIWRLSFNDVYSIVRNY